MVEVATTGIPAVISTVPYPEPAVGVLTTGIPDVILDAVRLIAPDGT
jgi:hypothetical protein